MFTEQGLEALCGKKHFGSKTSLSYMSGLWRQQLSLILHFMQSGKKFQLQKLETGPVLLRREKFATKMVRRKLALRRESHKGGLPKITLDVSVLLAGSLPTSIDERGGGVNRPPPFEAAGDDGRSYEQPVVEPQLSHFRQVPLRTSVKFPQLPQASPS